MSAHTNKAILQRIYEEVFSQGKLDRIDELVAPDAIEHEVVPGLEGATGPQALREFTRAFRAAFPDLKVTAEDWITEGDKVVARFTLTGTHRGEFLGMPPSGKTIKIEGIDIVRVANGKLVEHWGSTDNLGLMEQLGALPEPM